jgi:cathepsin L
MKLIVFMALVATISAKTLWHQLEGYSFEHYKTEYGKVYHSESEHEFRRKVFENTLAAVQKHNADPTKSWKEGINHMSDWTDDEFKALLGYDKAIALQFHGQPHPEYKTKVDVAAIPDNLDWRDEGIVTTVKDQGRCGSCWSFASAETLESHIAKQTGILQVLSEQNILDCTPNPKKCGGTGGCEGGTAELAYGRMVETGGLTTEWIYPYLSHNGTDFKHCQFDPKTSVVQVTGYQKLPTNKYQPLLQAVVSEGPIAVSVDASSWKNYESGIYNGCNQTNPDIDHAVVLVGYGVDDKNNQYWTIRNSWTPHWGELGFIRLFRDDKQESLCGEDLNPADGFGCAGGPSKMTICGTCGVLSDSVYPTIKV